MWPSSFPAFVGTALLLAFCFFLVDGVKVGEQCKLQSKAGQGICMNVTDCPTLFDMILKGENRLSFYGNCDTDSDNEIVCCPTNISPKHVLRAADIACEDYYRLATVLSNILIYHGIPVSTYEFPYMVALGYRKNDSIEYNCGGTLISAEHVLTAAHCVRNSLKRVPVMVQLGALNLTALEPGSERIRIAEITVHHGYRVNKFYNDLAVLRLEKKVEFNTQILPMCLPSEGRKRYIEANNSNLVVVGWGSTDFEVPSSNQLQKTPYLSLADKGACAEFYTNMAGLERGLAEYMLCVVDQNTTRGSDACRGDSGGPLVKDTDGLKTVIGVTSFGIGCGGTIPGIYTSIYPFLDWIEHIVWKKPILDAWRNNIQGQASLSASAEVQNNSSVQTLTQEQRTNQLHARQSGVGIVQPRIWI